MRHYHRICILILLFIIGLKAHSQVTYGPDGIIFPEEILADSLGVKYNNCLEILEQINERFKEGSFSDHQYLVISRFIIENEIEIGYPFILNNIQRYKSIRSNRPSEVMAGARLTINYVFDGIISQKKIVLFMEHILFRSGYLHQELSTQQLDILKFIFSHDSFELINSEINNLNRVDNLNKLKKMIQKK